jgi:DNA modification methylase
MNSRPASPIRIHHGDCIEIMEEMPANSVDFILTDPPYLVNYRDRIRVEKHD